MKNFALCRRTFVCTLAIVALSAVGIVTRDAHVGMAIALVAVGLSASNAYEGSQKSYKG